jgi:hypothetical protein
MVDLVRRKAWADPHKLELPKDSGTPISLYGKVENKGTASTAAQVRFVISEGATGAQLAELVTEAVVLAPGEIMDLASEWPNPSPGRFQVVAQAWYDSNADGVPDTPGHTTKRFKLDIKTRGTVDLARRKAWVDDKHFDPSEGDGALTLFATVENSGMGAARVVVRFQIADQQSGGPVLELMTDEVLLEPGQLMDLSADWVDPPLGEFRVLAAVWYDSDGDGSLDATGKHVKEFEVEIGSEAQKDNEDEDGQDNKHKKDEEVEEED